MQPVTLTDLAAAARVLLTLPPARRRQGMTELIARATTADAYRRTTGLAHADGNGTLGAAALTCPQAQPAAPGDRDYLSCLALALGALLKEEQDHRPLENPPEMSIFAGRKCGDAPCPNSSPGCPR